MLDPITTPDDPADWLAQPIPAEIIEAARTAGACEEALLWLETEPRTVHDLLQTLSTDRNACVRAAVARHPSTPKVLLEALAMDSNRGVRSRLAANRNTPEHVLQALGGDLWTVRLALVGNPSTPSTTLGGLFDDPCVEVRCALAERGQDEADRLHADRHCKVRLAAMGHAGLSLVCAAALFDPDARVRQAARQRIATDPSANPGLLTTTLGLAAQDADLRQALAQSPAAPALLLHRLACDLDPEVRAQVAQHPTTHALTLLTLTNDPDPYVRAMAALRTASVGALEQLAGDRDLGVRYCVTQNPHCPPHTLAQLLDDPDPAVRLGAAHPHENTP